MWLRRLAAEHDIASFRSGNSTLDGWLEAAAFTADAKGTARVYVWPDTGNAIQGYVAIAPHSLDAGDLPRRLGRGEPAQIPSYLIAKLALDKGLQGRGLGAALLSAALEVIIEASDRSGGRYVVVDAIDEKADSFYRHHGFTATTMPRRLVLKMSSARKERDPATRAADS
ncbi:GNAT family N-acetyltransferase [Nocardioides carbamazepini]|jgi:GNAT superfamily N-acetyltransferase|uniref:GNAT family N-acetyltransferase n=1 Tax=Nocardioides carbamazepini TaxID=2854259 RepID=UPI00214A86F4|nr:GNAT family N-acetyltransferase [Nocardioides carbamazepini]MCR1783550.1 GNAT family N-acetyltransferase [Nocardioides carbamazepini]